MSDDYGYFGKGITGYVHYNEAVKRNSGGGGGGGGGGCSTTVLVLVILMILYVVGSCAGACN